MVRLNSPWRRNFSKEDFDQYPIWVWDDENFGHLPLSEPSYEHGTLFIKAHFKTGGYTFEGFLVGGSSFYAFCIFFNNEEFYFNLNLTKLMEEEIKRIFRILNCEPFVFFPVYYKAVVTIENQKKISGILYG